MLRNFLQSNFLSRSLSGFLPILFLLVLSACGGGTNNSGSAIPAAGLYLVAGNTGSPGFVDGTGTDARFSKPQGIAADAAGNLYVADTDNQTVRKITPAGAVSVLPLAGGSVLASIGNPGSSSITSPSRVAVDAAGNLFVAEWRGSGRLYKISADGVFSSLDNLSRNVFTAPFSRGDIYTGTTHPSGMAFDSAGNMYVTDTKSHVIRKITAASEVSILAGSEGIAGNADGSGNSALFSTPAGLAIDASGNLYVADQGNNAIRKITAAGAVITLAGNASASGSADGSGTSASFNGPQGVAVDAAGNLYVADTGNHTIRKLTPAGTVSTLAGAAGAAGSADGTGPVARFNTPSDLTTDTAGNLYVADTGNNTVRKLTPAGVASTLAGSAAVFGSTDGSAATALFNTPSGAAADAAGNLYIADTFNNTIRKISATGTVSTLAGTAGAAGSVDGKGSAARFFYPVGLVTDASGNVYVLDNTASPASSIEQAAPGSTIRKIAPDGTVSTIAGNPATNGSTDGNGTNALFDRPRGLAIDAAGNLYVADTYNSTIRKITPEGVVTTPAGAVKSFGHRDGVGSAAYFDYPMTLTVDASGNLFVAESCTSIRMVTPDGSVSTKTIVQSDLDWLGIGCVRSIAADTSGNLYLAASTRNRVYKLTPGGILSTVAGSSDSRGIVLGSLPGRLDRPTGLALIDDKTLAVLSPGAVLKLVLP